MTLPTAIDLYQERAAIIEYDGNLSRSYAERSALKAIPKKFWAACLKSNRETAYPHSQPL